VVLALVGAGIAVIASQAGNRQIELRENVDGDVNRAIDELRGLIDDNTR
jgi:hypothetical protein